MFVASSGGCRRTGEMGCRSNEDEEIMAGRGSDVDSRILGTVRLRTRNVSFFLLSLNGTRDKRPQHSPAGQPVVPDAL